MHLAFKRPPTIVSLHSELTDRTTRESVVSLPDGPSLLAMKLFVRDRRDEVRDCEDIWRCMEVVYKQGCAGEFRDADDLADARSRLQREIRSDSGALAMMLRFASSSDRSRIDARVRALASQLL